MTILIAKLPRKTFSSADGAFNLYFMRIAGGQWESAVYIGDSPPKALKTVEYQLTGEWEVNERNRSGKQFRIHSWQRYVKAEHPADLAISQHLNKHL